MAKFPCGICQKAVATKNKAICCDLLNKWIHTGCNNLKKTTYIQIQHGDSNWFWVPCLEKEAHFNTLTDHELEKVYNGKNMLPFISKSMQSFTKKANNFLQHETNNMIHCLHYDIPDFNKMVATCTKSFSLLHLNISSLPDHSEEFDEHLISFHIKVNVIGITESCL